MRLARSLTTLGVVFIMFFNVSGGAFTTETLVAETGPGLALLILVVVPIVWSVPEALIVGELASMMPEEGGYYRWVYRAFGPFWAFQNGWYTWLYSLVDMAIYPVLFTQYLAWFLPDLSPGASWAIKLGVIWGATAINLRGAFRVGRFSTWAGLFILATFLAIAVAALAHGVPAGTVHAPWTPFVKPGETPLAGIGVGLSIALWNYFGWDNASTVAGEVVDGTRTYPRALAIAVPMVAAGYLVPLLATLATSDWTTWREGGWPEIARATGGALGPALAAAVAVAGMVSALALYNALLLAFSRIPLAMATDGYLPRVLARTDARGTPRAAVLFAAVLYSAFTLLPFAQLVVADALLYALAMFLEFGALVALRRREPTLRGAFRIPVGTAGIVVLTIVPALVFLAATGFSLAGGEHGAMAVVGAIVAAALGPLAYRVAARGAPMRRAALLAAEGSGG
ncbi:MAG TPA: APC family permease [Gemmatirosa sp.]|nr:APC family permease [Gemmatirosa sp.]